MSSAEENSRWAGWARGASSKSPPSKTGSLQRFFHDACLRRDRRLHQLYTSTPKFGRVQGGISDLKTAYSCGVLNVGERLRTGGLAFTRQRSLVRSQHRPL